MKSIKIIKYYLARATHLVPGFFINLDLCPLSDGRNMENLFASGGQDMCFVDSDEGSYESDGPNLSTNSTIT